MRWCAETRRAVRVRCAAEAHSNSFSNALKRSASAIALAPSGPMPEDGPRGLPAKFRLVCTALPEDRASAIALAPSLLMPFKWRLRELSTKLTRRSEAMRMPSAG